MRNDCAHLNQRFIGASWSCEDCGASVSGKGFSLERIRSVGIAPSAMPSRKNAVAPHRPNNSWERGNRTDERGIPYLTKTGRPLKLGEGFDRKQYTDNTIRVQSTSTGSN